MNNVNYSNIYNDDHIYIYENDQIMQNLLTRIRRLRAEQEELYDSINGFDDIDFIHSKKFLLDRWQDFYLHIEKLS